MRIGGRPDEGLPPVYFRKLDNKFDYWHDDLRQ